MDDFTLGYIREGLRTEYDNSDDATGGDPLDIHYSIEDIAPEALSEIERDCLLFQKDFAAEIKGRETEAGRYLWLSRNGHGAGFFSSEWGIADDKLQAQRKQWGNRTCTSATTARFMSSKGEIDGHAALRSPYSQDLRTSARG